MQLKETNSLDYYYSAFVHERQEEKPRWLRIQRRVVLVGPKRHAMRPLHQPRCRPGHPHAVVGVSLPRHATGACARGPHARSRRATWAVRLPTGGVWSIPINYDLKNMCLSASIALYSSRHMQVSRADPWVGCDLRETKGDVGRRRQGKGMVSWT